MKQNLIMCGIAALAICSCTNEVVDSLGETKSSDISFSTSVGNMTRSITTASSLEQFNVNAYLNQGDKTMYYIKDLKVNKSNGLWEPENTYTWPYSGKMTFFSYSPADLDVTMPASENLASTQPTINALVSSNPERQKDILYAVNEMDAAKAYSGTASDKVVNVNFRHALSQVVFSAKNTNPNWILSIYDVQIVNIKSKGTYTFPTATTAPLSDGGMPVKGNWSHTEALNTYVTSFNAVENIGADAVELTTSAKGSILVLPQTAQAWEPKTDPYCENKGVYFMIRCKIQQITPDGTALLWPSKSTDTAAYVAVPANIDWQEGMKYTYTFIFGDGAGFIPPTNTEGGDEVIPGSDTFARIQFSVAVDDFQQAGDKDIEM